MWYIVDLDYVGLPKVCEEEDVVVCRGNEEILHKIFFPYACAGSALAAAPLFFIGADGEALYVSGVAYGDHHVFFCDEVLDLQFFYLADDIGPALVSKTLLQLKGLVCYDIEYLLLAPEYAFEYFDPFYKIQVLLVYLFPFKAGQLLELHLKNRLCLPVTKVKALHKLSLCSLRILGLLYQLYDPIQVLKGNL